MSEAVKYSVRIKDGNAYLDIAGRANYLNCKLVGKFFELALGRGCKKFFLNFAQCKGMDSTFMGMIASLALKLINQGCPDSVILCSLEGRNLELIENLGLDSLVKIQDAPEEFFPREFLGSESAAPAEILEAHKSLIAANPANAKEFEEVVSFIQKELERQKRQ